MSSIARSDEALQMMAWDQFVKHGRPREVNVVSAHAHHLCFVAHRIRRIGDLNRLAAQKERADELAFGSHHLHSPRIARELRNRNKIVIVHELDRFKRKLSDQLRLFARLDV